MGIAAPFSKADHVSPPINPDAPFAVVIICFNQEGYIGDTIESVLAQTALDQIREIFVVDDLSKDRSVDMARSYAEIEPRIQVVPREVNSGGCAAPRNSGMELSHAPYIALLDGDDLWAPTKVARELDVLSAHPEIGLLFSDYIVFDDKTGSESPVATRHYEASDEGQLERFFIHGGPVIPSCAVLSKAAIDQVGLFDPTMKFNEDSEMWNRVATVAPIHHIKAPLMKKREWFGSLGSAKYGLQNIACKHEITDRMVERVPALSEIAHLRRSQIEFKTAVHHFGQGDTSLAQAHLKNALAADPSNRKAKLYMALSRLPGDPNTYLAFGRRLRNMMLSRKAA